MRSSLRLEYAGQPCPSPPYGAVGIWSVQAWMTLTIFIPPSLVFPATMTGAKRSWSSAFDGSVPAPAFSNTLKAPARYAPIPLNTNENQLTRNVCFGMVNLPMFPTFVSSNLLSSCQLCDVKAEFLDGFQLADARVDTIRKSNEIYHPLKIRVRRHYILQSTTGADTALLNLRSSQTLRALGDDIHCSPFVAAKEWSSKLGHFKNHAKTQMSIYLNLYGSPPMSAQVGKALSKAKLFLQHPIFLEDRVRYENPHYSNISTSKASGSTLPTPPSKSSLEIIRIPDPIASVLDSLGQQMHLQEVEVDQNSIKTHLERYHAS